MFSAKLLCGETECSPKKLKHAVEFIGWLNCPQRYQEAPVQVPVPAVSSLPNRTWVCFASNNVSMLVLCIICCTKSWIFWRNLFEKMQQILNLFWAATFSMQSTTVHHQDELHLLLLSSLISGENNVITSKVRGCARTCSDHSSLITHHSSLMM